MTNNAEEFEYAPAEVRDAYPEDARRRLNLGSVRPIGIVAVCDRGEDLRNTRPSTNMSITQFLQLADGSLIRLDMDRGVSTFRYGSNPTPSWKRSAHDVAHETITIIQADTDGEFPWDDYAASARLRGIDVTTADLSGLPVSVQFTQSLAELFEM